MNLSTPAGTTLEEYRELETRLHHELMNTCRKYIYELGIVSIMGILDIVKQETIELEKATRRNPKKEEFESERKKGSEEDIFSRQQPL